MAFFKSVPPVDPFRDSKADAFCKLILRKIPSNICCALLLLLARPRI